MSGAAAVSLDSVDAVVKWSVPEEESLACRLRRPLRWRRAEPEEHGRQRGSTDSVGHTVGIRAQAQGRPHRDLSLIAVVRGALLETLVRLIAFINVVT